jgi:hypothetical protein
MADPARPANRRRHVNARNPVLGVVLALIILGFGLIPGRHASAECGKDVACWTWTALETKGEPPIPRWGHSAVWTGKEMLVFGGAEDLQLAPNFLLGKSPGTVRAVFNDLWSYTPSTKAWKKLHPSGHLPPRRSNHTAVWNGHEMLVYGGWRTNTADWGLSVYNDVWGYSPEKNRWEQRTVRIGTAPFRNWHTAVWVIGDANNPAGFMMVFGGYDPTAYPPPGMPQLLHDTNDTLGFSLGTGQWTSTVNIGLPLPPPRSGTAAVWSDRPRLLGGMWFFGGFNVKRGMFDDAWHWFSASEFDEVKLLHPEGTTPLKPLARAFHTAVLIDGDQFLWMVIFGGTDWFGMFNDLNALALERNERGNSVGNWIVIPTADNGRPPPRYMHTAVWTGQEMLVFGGTCSDSPVHSCSQQPIGKTLWSLRPPAGLLH